MRPSLLLSFIMLAGCARAGFEARASDGAVDGAPPLVDGSATDGAGDAPSPTDISIIDSIATEGGADAGCIVSGEIADDVANCTISCANPPDDNQDCDALLDSDDPEPAACNAALLRQELAADPAQETTLWQQSGPQSWSCDALRIGPGASLTKRAASTSSTARYVVEARFRLEEIIDAELWTARIALGPEGGGAFQCELWVRALLGVSVPTARIASVNSCRMGESYSTNGFFPPAAAGRSYMLRAWHDGAEIHCVAIDEGADLVIVHSSSQMGACVPTWGESLSFEVDNISVSLDYLRSYELGAGGTE